MQELTTIYRDILESMAEGIIFADADDRLTFINRTAEDIRGIKARNFIGRTILSVHSPNSAKRIKELLQKLRDGSIKQARRVIEVKGRYFENSYYPVTSPDGGYQGTLLISRDVTERQQLQHENQSLKQRMACGSFGGFVSISSSMLPVFQTIGAVAGLESTVLITGESGTGKELVAAAIHRNSARKERAMVTVNCAALPEHLVESELFGYQRGAFTGAVSNHRGKFEQADKSTIFLDEVGDLPANAQAKLLRVLQERTVSRLGNEKDIRVDVRIIAATNRNLQQMVADGLFREDLYYRLNVISLPVPPLRERREDILPMAEYFLKKFSERMERPQLGICEATRAVLLSYDYPGNVRELEHAIERAVALCPGSCISPADLPEQFVAARSSGGPDWQQPLSVRAGDQYRPDDAAPATLANAREESERRLILDALVRTGGRKAEAAKLLNISRKTLWEKLKLINQT
ncbi:sigma 54-interacting transcriptional regulator [Trichlorobacter lovleyi]|uniref:sigma-54 interaction domain-containing protein n=1 Tax=Trichlorobacter lovleyi TaxID=313985 RepID=UPI00223EEFB4|nr:sigma 54-interacting transcriptional regulator [Trichlorobacter lovleyi]QOX78202.1 sigma 54-interacting transcriptional regulator [Trichlorobacter lovleyi]